MQAIHYDDAPTAQWGRDHELLLHKKRLQEIKFSPAGHFRMKLPTTKKFLPFLSQNFRIVLRAKDQKIQRENLFVMNRLAQITVEHTNFQVHIRQGPLSLNFPLRKREALRIEEENQAVLKRLTQVESPLAKQKFVKDYAASVRYRNTISRRRLFRNKLQSHCASPKIALSSQNRELSASVGNRAR